MGRVVFMVNTEYHLLMSLGIIRKYYKKGHNIYIYRVSPINGTRLNRINLCDSDILYKEILYDYSHPNYNLKEKINELIELKPEVFFFFLENKFWMNYLFSKMHKNGTKIILAPDGMKAYNDKKVAFVKVVKSYLLGLINSFESRIFYLPFVEKYYATSRYIDEIWVENSSKFKNRTNKKVFEFIIPYDESFIAELNKVFKINNDDFGIMNKKTILFLDSSFSSESYFNNTVNILKELQKKYPDRTLIIKLHQLSSCSAKQRYESISGAIFVESHYPAELYIANAKDSLVVSLISTSLLFYNPCCRYFWIYPMFKNIADYSKILNPTKHIKVANNISEL